MSALRGGGAKGPDERSAHWYVPVSRLVELLNAAVNDLSAGRVEQSVDITGRVNEAVLHRFELPPDVRVVLSLDPAAAAASTRASLLFDGNEPPVVNGASTWPVEVTVPAGLYILRVDTEAPFKPITARPIGVLPPRSINTVQVT